MTNHVYKGDLPDDLDLGPIVAIDCETMGLNPKRDRLCVVQLSLAPDLPKLTPPLSRQA